jgi:hypothetical protein
MKLFGIRIWTLDRSTRPGLAIGKGHA